MSGAVPLLSSWRGQGRFPLQLFYGLTLNLLTTTIVAPPSNASK